MSGITVYGLKTFVDGYRLHVPQGYDAPDPELDHAVSAEQERDYRMGRATRPDSDSGPVVYCDPLYLSEAGVDSLIAGGALTPGIFNGLRVVPPRDTWPEKWHALKTE